jgi:hypothetical protein
LIDPPGSGWHTSGSGLVLVKGPEAGVDVAALMHRPPVVRGSGRRSRGRTHGDAALPPWSPGVALLGPGRQLGQRVGRRRPGRQVENGGDRNVGEADLSRVQDPPARVVEQLQVGGVSTVSCGFHRRPLMAPTRRATDGSSPSRWRDRLGDRRPGRSARYDHRQHEDGPLMTDAGHVKAD